MTESCRAGIAKQLKSHIKSNVFTVLIGDFKAVVCCSRLVLVPTSSGQQLAKFLGILRIGHDT